MSAAHPFKPPVRYKWWVVQFFKSATIRNRWVSYKMRTGTVGYDSAREARDRMTQVEIDLSLRLRGNLKPELQERVFVVPIPVGEYPRTIIIQGRDIVPLYDTEELEDDRAERVA